jgi:hypothetical protein
MHGHRRSVRIFPEKDASENSEAIGETCLNLYTVTRSCGQILLVASFKSARG